MTREQVIKGLECHSDPIYGCDACPYSATDGDDDCGWRELCKDALALLKEQEPKQARKVTYHVKITQGYEKPRVATRYDWLCPTCKSLLCRGIDVIDDNYHFCKVCGQAVRWE